MRRLAPFGETATSPLACLVYRKFSLTYNANSTCMIARAIYLLLSNGDIQQVVS